tara:strand:- start:793 stop:978 length:186 start_codon:yes stop_codon:yes gene_type:complete
VKINIDKNNYISIKKQDGKDYTSLSIKVRKDDDSYLLVSLSLDDDSLDKMISEMVSIRAKG